MQIVYFLPVLKYYTWRLCVFLQVWHIIIEDMNAKGTIRNYSDKDIKSLVDFTLLDSFNISREDCKLPALFLEYPHSIEGVAISICTKGYGKARIAFKEHEITPRTMLVVIPDVIIEPLEKSEDISFETIYFSYDFMSEVQLPTHFNVIDKIIASPCVSLSLEEYAIIRKYHAFIAEQYIREISVFKSRVIKNLLFALIWEILSIYSIIEANFSLNSRAEKLSNNFVKMLLKNYKTERYVSFYANKLCVTDKYLMTLIKRETGKSISTWINGAVISHAKRELKTTDKSISLISDELNFSSTSQFCRYFKKHTKLTPRQYRISDTSAHIFLSHDTARYTCTK